MKMHAITHFDREYLPLGCAMLESLTAAMPQASVSVLALGDEVAVAVREHFPEVKLLSLIDLEKWDSRVIQSQNRMSRKEFAWFLEVALCNYWMQASQDEWLVYTDADMHWYQSLEPILANIPRDKCVAVTPHHFPENQKHREESVGRYNFGVGAFRPSCPEARLLLNQWLDAAFLNCGEKSAGHQPYLNQWIGLPQVHELPKSVNVGPWSLRRLWTDGDCCLGADGAYPTVSYHFHEFRPQHGLTSRQPVMIGGVPWNLTNYPIHELTMGAVYQPYCAKVGEWIEKLNWRSS